jgi:uncharacterized membrane protein YqjE
MSLETLVYKMIQEFSWLFHRRWKAWELITMGVIIALFCIWRIRSSLRSMNYPDHRTKWPIHH